MVSVCLPSDALLQHLPSYLGFFYLGRGVSLHGCSSKPQPLLLTLEEVASPDLEHGVAPLGPPALMQPCSLDVGLFVSAATPDLGRGVAPLSCHPWPQMWGSSSRCSCTVAAWYLSRRPWPWAWGSSSRPLPLNLGVGYSHEPGGKGGNWNVGKRFYICLTGNNSWLSYLEQTSLIDPFIVPVYLRCNLRIHFQPQVSGSHYQSIQHRLWEEASLPFLYQVISKVFILCKHYIHGRQLSTWPSLSL